MKKFDLLSMVEYGGCSAKLPARELEDALSGLPKASHPNLLVGSETHDDAGVYKISEEMALVQTTDFFPPVCSDPYEFGQIAAANALSDVYAMGGEVLTALNIVMFPAHAPLDVLKEILQGGTDKVTEAGGVILGGHTIVDPVPKYGLAVTGIVHPSKIITNAAAQEGDVLLLSKPIGAGVILAGKRLGEVSQADHQAVLESMKQLNKHSGAIMQKFGVRCATDITGFGLAGHALKLALASNVTVHIETGAIPCFHGVEVLLELGCIPGACFRNQEYAGQRIRFSEGVSYEKKMLMFDAQTSGGMLICCPEKHWKEINTQLRDAGYVSAERVGSIGTLGSANVIFEK
jgi:selenide,water dikinase